MLFILVLIVNIFCIPNASTKIHNPAAARLVALVLVAVLILSETSLYLSLLPDNFYRIYQDWQINRTHTKQELKSAYKWILLNHHPDKNPEVSSDEFQFLANINSVLTSNKVNYDKYGLARQEKEYVVESVKNEQFIHFFLFYGIGLMMLLIQTYPAKYRPARKFCLMIAGVFAGYEYLIMENDQFADLYLSAVLPQVTCFEALFIQRIIFSAIVGGILFKMKSKRTGLELVEYLVNQKEVDWDRALKVTKNVKSKMKVDEQLKNSRVQRVVNLVVIVMILVFFVGQHYVERFHQLLE